MPNEITQIAYECSECHKVYTNRDDALKCEKSHKCPCEKWDFCRFGYDEYRGETFISGVYFKEKRIVLRRIDYGGTAYERTSTSIKYCPFCGRELKDDDKSEQEQKPPEAATEEAEAGVQEDTEREKV